MITAVVQFPLPKGTTRSDAAEMFKQAAPKYREVPGLMRKYFLFDEDAPIGGGVYLWENREAANKVYSPEWRQMVADRYGAEPTITYFDTLLVVDNLVGEISGDEA